MANDTIIIACATLKKELTHVMQHAKSTLPVVWVDSGLHVRPEKLRACVMDILSQLPAHYKTCLMVFGFCGNSMVGVQSGTRTLVLPLVSDCIPLFMGSQESRDSVGSDAYFLTEGYLHFEHTLFTEFNIYRQRYGDERAKRITKKIMAHYKQFAVIDTGAFDPRIIADEIRPSAQQLDIPVNIVKGNLKILEEIIQGNYGGGGFLIVPPQGEITFQDSLCVGKSQFDMAAGQGMM